MHYVELTAHYHTRSCPELVSNVMLMITVVFGDVLSVGGGVWERLHSAHVMNSTSLELGCYQYCATTLHLQNH